LTLEDTRVAVTPLNGMLRLAGTMEFGSRNDDVNDIRVEAIRQAARQSFRDWGENPTRERAPWAGSRPMTPDGLPVIGGLGTAKNAYINSGHSMLGLTLAPASAKVLTDIMLDRSSSLSTDLLARISPHRF
ncbi:MAG: NAD(P)/FAD-dependent oxidoreductase, partial [Brevibacterium aurantiacum]